jgi:DNA-directed RNA polymerase alpha subunit
MVVVVAVALTIWGVKMVRSRLVPSIAESQADATYKQAKLVREVAEYALKEYTDDFYVQELANTQNQMATAKADRERALDRLKWSTEALAKGQVSPETKIADELTLQMADFDVEQSRMQLEVLKKYTKEKQRKSLLSDIEKAKADEQAKFKAYQKERARRLWWGE